MWKPNLSQSSERKGEGSLLFAAYDKISGPILTKLEDSVGVYALDLFKFVLVAKKELYGNIVSCHKHAVYSALNSKKPLVMYIASLDKFYSFDPREIINNSQENKKGNAFMLNFEIKLGERYDV